MPKRKDPKPKKPKEGPPDLGDLSTRDLLRSIRRDLLHPAKPGKVAESQVPEKPSESKPTDPLTP
jgi:hypothetical protein